MRIKTDLYLVLGKFIHLFMLLNYRFYFDDYNPAIGANQSRFIIKKYEVSSFSAFRPLLDC